ncbi:hypothetical protein HAX54_006802 [Datura stramonium]|uniref:Uncharacterized protein n=1 Tax=Datura stramonium TaxID=4076 RepID=A0ABS8RUN3_DATST|nr:hypothetical protein [Datura stramonium]
MFRQGKRTPKKPPTEGEPPAKRGRGRPRNKPAAPNTPPPPTIPPADPIHTAPVDYPTSSSAPPDFHASSSVPTTGKRGKGRGRESTSPYKRPKVVFQAENSFKHGMSSSKILSTDPAKVTRSTEVTGDIGFKPSTGSKLKWNGKAVISIRKLQ